MPIYDSKRPLSIIVFLGVLLGVSVMFAPGILCIFFCILLTYILIKSFAKEEDKHFILTIFLIGMGTRILLGTAIHLLSIYLHLGAYYCPDLSSDPLIEDRFAFGLIGDGAFTSLKGWWWSQIWHDKIKLDWFISGSQGPDPYDYHFYLYAIFYYLFGFSQLAAKFINSLFSVGMAILIYYIAKDVFNRRVAKVAAILSAFFPTIILWSVTALKEPISSFFLCLTIFSLQRLIFQRKIRYLFPLFISFANIFIRQQFGIFTLLIASFSLFIGLLKSKFLRLIIITVIFAIMITPVAREKINSVESKLIYRINILIGMQRGSSSAGSSAYRIYPEDLERISSVKQLFSLSFVFSVVKGLGFFLLVPFPWSISSKLQLITYPQVVLWYFLLGFALLGIAYALRYNFKKSILVLFFLFSSALLSGMASGNIGSAMRHRDIITPLFLLFSAAGLTFCFPQRAKIHAKSA